MEFFFTPSAWAGLLTLIILEVVLGIDNLIFVAILSEKLPPNQRDQGRLIGLGLALIMRLALLSIISWVATLNTPIIHNNFFYFISTSCSYQILLFRLSWVMIRCHTHKILFFFLVCISGIRLTNICKA